jgi:RimJ/RimL family protein N-acetyltransferase
MCLISDKREIVQQLERDVLRNIVLLKHINAFPGHARATLHRSDRGAAALVLLDARASGHDREAYPQASDVALISSDEPALIRELLPSIPQDGGIVFKLSSDHERDIVEEKFLIERTTSYLSFTSAAAFPADDQVLIGETASDAMFDMFRSQHHPRAWLQPLLAARRAFTCVLNVGTEPLSACFAFENHGHVWEIGGVVTSPSHRGRGLASRIVRSALAEATRRGLLPRYQASEDNLPSIRLAQSIGMTQFLSLTHYVRFE